jgi:hypothetical protein
MRPALLPGRHRPEQRRGDVMAYFFFRLAFLPAAFLAAFFFFFAIDVTSFLLS